MLWDAYGGVTHLAEQTGINRQNLTHWRRRNGVPLSQCGRIARALEVDIFALNYVGVFELLGKGPSWVTVVRNLKLHKTDTDYVLEGEHPHVNL